MIKDMIVLQDVGLQFLAEYRYRYNYHGGRRGFYSVFRGPDSLGFGRFVRFVTVIDYIVLAITRCTLAIRVHGDSIEALVHPRRFFLFRGHLYFVNC